MEIPLKVQGQEQGQQQYQVFLHLIMVAFSIMMVVAHILRLSKEYRMNAEENARLLEEQVKAAQQQNALTASVLVVKLDKAYNGSYADQTEHGGGDAYHLFQRADTQVLQQDLHCRVDAHTTEEQKETLGVQGVEIPLKVQGLCEHSCRTARGRTADPAGSLPGKYDGPG